MITRKERNDNFDRSPPERANRHFKDTVKLLGKRLTQSQKREIEEELRSAAQAYDKSSAEPTYRHFAEKFDLVNTATQKLLSYLASTTPSLGSVSFDGWLGELIQGLPEKSIKWRLVPQLFHEAQHELDREARAVATCKYILGDGIYQELQDLIDRLVRFERWSARASSAYHNPANIQQEPRNRAEFRFANAVLRLWSERTGNKLYAGKNLRPGAKKFTQTAAEDAGIQLSRRALTLAAKSLKNN